MNIGNLLSLRLGSLKTFKALSICTAYYGVLLHNIENAYYHLCKLGIFFKAFNSALSLSMPTLHIAHMFIFLSDPDFTHVRH